jgi:cation diffusion facilitator family transporter
MAGERGERAAALESISTEESVLNNFRAIQRVLWITMGLNLVATAAKLVVGYWTGSLSLIADGFDSVFDSASNVIGLVGIYFAARPADEDHPYGHRKAETMTALVIAMLLFLTTWELVKSAIERLQDPSRIQAEVNVWSFGALFVSILVHISVVWYELRAGRRLHSDVLVADAMHTRADIFVSLSVVAGLTAVRLGLPLADPIMALVVAGFIAKIGVDIIRESSPTLLDEVVMSAEEMDQIARSVPGVLSCHRVRSRGHETAVYADLHIQVDPSLSTEESHAIAHEVQRRMRERRPDIQDVTIHVEPAGSDHSPEITRKVETAVREAIRQLGGTAVCRQLTISSSGGLYALTVHCGVKGSTTVEEARHLVAELEAQIQQRLPQARSITIHAEPV